MQLFSHPDFTVGFGFTPNQDLFVNKSFADYTAGREFHPALKNFILLLMVLFVLFYTHIIQHGPTSVNGLTPA